MTGPRPLFLRNADLLATYNARFNRDLAAALGRLDAVSAALSDQLRHLLFMDRLWLARLGDPGSAAAMKDHAASQRADVASRAGWLEARRALDTDIARFIAALDTPDLDRRISFTTEAEGADVRCTMWAALTHMFNHQSLHRGEILRLLAQNGVVFGNSDLLPLIVEFPVPAESAPADVACVAAGD